MSANLLLDIGQSVVDLDFLSNTTGFFSQSDKVRNTFSNKENQLAEKTSYQRPLGKSIPPRVETGEQSLTWLL